MVRIQTKMAIYKRLPFNDATDAQSIISSLTDNPQGNADDFFLSGIKIGSSVGDFLLDLNVAAGQNSTFLYPLQESPACGNMDYTNQISKNDPSINSNVTVSGGVGYNNFDLGNHYWGKNMGAFGYSPGAANAFTILRHLEPDSPADQRAIINGVNSVKK